MGVVYLPDVEEEIMRQRDLQAESQDSNFSKG
jgi:hypothetical protein